MEEDEARRVLGVGPRETAEDLRAAYRRLVREHHPDVMRTPGAGPQATARTAAIITAYATLRRRSLAPEPARPADDAVEADCLVIAAPPDEAFFYLLEAAHELGETTYVDPGAGLLEVVIEGGGKPALSMVITLQGRSNGSTEANVAVEPLGQGLAPRLGPLVDDLAARIARRAR